MNSPLQQRMTQNWVNVLVTGSLVLVGIVVSTGIIQARGFSNICKNSEVSPHGGSSGSRRVTWHYCNSGLGTQRPFAYRTLIATPAVETWDLVNQHCSDKPDSNSKQNGGAVSFYTNQKRF
ncbi:hypothetical protein U9R62_03810 [Cylindrospermopsis raciborskii DSH]|uniref:hypothetical protein n=1 Tax=Cylindrospermopsis raciborskii TaxID=77022 RepID=UPI002ED8B532